MATLSSYLDADRRKQLAADPDWFERVMATKPDQVQQAINDVRMLMRVRLTHAQISTLLGLVSTVLYSQDGLTNMDAVIEHIDAARDAMDGVFAADAEGGSV